MKRSNKEILNKINGKSRLGSGVKLAGFGVVCAPFALSSWFTEQQQLRIYQDGEDCASDNPGQLLRCESSYQMALSRWQSKAPRYQSLSSCEYDFGSYSCEPLKQHFIPRMKGFSLAERDLDDEDFDVDLDFDRPRPLTYSTSPSSSYGMYWINAHGDSYGRYGERRVKVDKDWYQSPKRLKGNAKVLGRGGFGKIARSASRGS